VCALNSMLTGRRCWKSSSDRLWFASAKWA